MRAAGGRRRRAAQPGTGIGNDDLLALDIDVQREAMPQIVAPLAVALANPDAPLGVGAAAVPAAGGPATPQELNAITPTEGGDTEDERAKAKAKAPRRGLGVFDYVNRFLDATLGRP